MDAGSGAGGDDAGMARVSAIQVLTFTTLMAAASGLGAIPFFFVGELSKAWAGIANALACGVMLAASFDLIHEGQPYGGTMTCLGVMLGAWGISRVQHFLEKYEDMKFIGTISGASARKTIMMMGVMGAHALGEGSGVGVSFSGTRGFTHGILVTLAIGIHNIPEGLAVSTVLAARGVGAWHCAAWAVLTSLPQPLLAVPSFLFVEAFRSFLPLGLGVSAGCMIWMVCAELIPDALEAIPGPLVATVATLSAAGLEWFRMTMAGLETPEGELMSPIPRELLPALFGSAFPPLAAAVAGAGVAYAFRATGASGRGAAATALGAAAGAAGALGAGRAARQVVRFSTEDEGALGPALAAAAGAAACAWVARLLPQRMPTLEDLGAEEEEGEGRRGDEEAGGGGADKKDGGGGNKGGAWGGGEGFRAAALLLLAMTASGAAEGAALGRAAVAFPMSVVHLVLPMCLEAIPRGAATACAAMVAAGGSAGRAPWLAAGAAGALIPMGAFQVLSDWWLPATISLELLRAGAGGALAYAAWALLRVGGAGARKGAGAGAGVGGLVVLATLAMCGPTPYCVDIPFRMV